MAITTLDGVIAGNRPPVFVAKAVSNSLVAGRPFTAWGLAGTNGAGAYDTTLNGVVLSSTSALVPGQIPHFDSATLSYLGSLEGSGSTPCRIILADRLWHNGGINATLTTAQTIVSPTWPARCPTSGTNDTPSTNGYGVLLAVEVSAAVGAGTPTITIGYTNSDGTAGRTATNILATAASVVAQTTYFIGLQAGDLGVRSVQSITLSATWTSGTINLVAYRVIQTLAVVISNTPAAIDATTGGLPRIYNGAVPYLMCVPNSTTAISLIVNYMEAHG
jgi:hypothetical protein